MTDLYQRHGGMPAPLPQIAFDDENYAYTPPYTNAALAHLGFTPAPPQPAHDPATQRVEWIDGAWAVVDLPPAPPAPEPEPISMTVGEFVNRFRIPAENDAFARLEDAMDLESRLVRRQWANDATVMTEGEGLWAIIAGHLDSIVTPERKAELLARPGAVAAFADEAMAA